MVSEIARCRMAKAQASALLRRIVSVHPSSPVALTRTTASVPFSPSPLSVLSPILPRLYSSSSAETPPQQPPSTTNPRDLSFTKRKPTTRAVMRARGTSAPTGSINDLIQKSRLYNMSIHRSLYPMKEAPKRKIKRIHLPTHYVEVSYKLRKAVVFYQPSIAHIPHGVKERNPVLVTSGVKRGQNT